MTSDAPFDRDPKIALAGLIEVLRHAHSGETAAIFAYEGHWKSVKDPEERRQLQKIEQDKKDHLEIVSGFLAQLNVESNKRRDRVFWCVGKVIGLLCRAGGWFIPMYGAGKLESPNIVEYEIAARHAWLAGYERWVESLLTLAEIEWDHEFWLREKTLSHPFSRLVPMWQAPPPRGEIRTSFEEFTKSLR